MNISDLAGRYLSSFYRCGMKFLKSELGVPNRMLAIPGKTKLYVDGEELIEVSGTKCTLGSPAAYERKLDDPMIYSPPAIYVERGALKRTAESIKTTEEQLFLILLAHEAIHVLMMSCFIGDEDPASKDWIEGADCRTIHEAVALRACARNYFSSECPVNEAAIERYLAYVKASAVVRADGVYYRPYFEQFSQCPDNQLWMGLTSKFCKTQFQ